MKCLFICNSASQLGTFGKVLEITLWTCLVVQMVKRLPIIQETWVQSLGQEDLLEKEMATHSSTLAWKIPWMEEPGGLQFMGLQRVGHDWATSVTHSERTLAATAWGGGCYRSLVSRDQGCLLISVLQCTGPPSPPPTKNYLVQSSVVLKNWVTKPCSIVSFLALKSTLSDINLINIHMG